MTRLSDILAGCFAVLGVAVLLGGTLFLWVWTLGQLRGTADIFVVRSWRLAAFAIPIGLGLVARARWAAVSFATVLGGWGLFTVVFAPQDLKNNVPALVANLLIACLLQTPALLTVLGWGSLTWLGTWPPWRRSTKT